METKKVLQTFLLFLSMTFSGIAYSEESESEIESELLEDDESVESGWQTLEWTETNPESVLRYEIILEEFDENTGKYKFEREIQLEDASTSVNIEPKLKAGKYRYKVITYDLIEFPSAQSEWTEFSIYKSYKPQIRDISSNVNGRATIYLEEYNDGIFTINGRNLFELEKDNPFNFTSYYLIGSLGKERQVLIPEMLEHDANNRKVKFLFDMDKLDTGKYNLIARDASGRTSGINENNEITIKFKKMMDLDVSLGYSVPINIFDNTLPTYLDTNLWTSSATGKLVFIPYKRRWGYLGVGLSSFYMNINSEFDGYSIDGNIESSHISAVYQKPLFRKVKKDGQFGRKHFMTLETRFGVGLTTFSNLLFHFPHSIESEPLNSSNLSIDAGVSAQFYLFKRLYLELNTDFVYSFISDMQLGMFVPSVLIGWQF